MLNRRDVLNTAAIGGVAALLPMWANKAVAAGNAPLAGTLQSLADTLLRNSPETATTLGMDRGALASLAGQVSDLSPAGNDRSLAIYKAARAQIIAVDAKSLSGADAAHYDMTLFSLDLAIEGSKFPYGSNGLGGGIPYIVSQQNGSYQQFPELLDSYQRVETKADIGYYLSRMEGFARQLDQETDQINADAARGVVMPDFLLTNTLGQMAQLRGVPAGEQRMVTSLATRAKKIVGVADPSAAATKIITDKIFPALDRQIAALKRLQPKADDKAGMWKLPDGDAYYAWLLRNSTTTRLTPDEIHATGLRQTAELQAGMDKVLVAQGFTKGSVGERMAALTADPRFVYPNTDAGRADIITFIQGRVDAVRPRMAELSNLKLHADVTVKRVPVEIQDGAGLGYMNFASLDGKRPAIYYVNLKDTAYWPKFTLPSLTAHEAIPGHAWQGAYIAENRDKLPLISSLITFNAFVEGWALYSETLVDEIGMYKDEPLWRLGFLQALNFRAVRLVVDTGMHAKKWTRQQAIDYMVANTGRAVGAVTSEIDRYCASPGQACGYKVGHNEIVRLREKAKAAMGPKFSLQAFNDAVVTTGGVPLDVLARVIDRYIAGA
jgi:uncharacterized protein (DUF885 family)